MQLLPAMVSDKVLISFTASPVSQDTTIQNWNKSSRRQERNYIAVAQDRLYKMMVKFIDCKTELQMERVINKIAMRYIPEEQQADFYSEWPEHQLKWKPSLPAPCKSYR
jgi:hypothetical protein